MQEELRFTSKDEPGTRFHWIFGLFYRDASQRASQILPGTLDPLTQACCGLTSLQFFGIPNYVDAYSQVDNGYHRILRARIRKRPASGKSRTILRLA